MSEETQTSILIKHEDWRWLSLFVPILFLLLNFLFVCIFFLFSFLPFSFLPSFINS
jgi:hypothetical protein